MHASIPRAPACDRPFLHAQAERCVLPALNNLLENREMALDDGRFIVAPSRFDALLATRSAAELAQEGLLRAHPDFRVVALGVPVPAYPGHPLDPPLRSRFQAGGSGRGGNGGGGGQV